MRDMLYCRDYVATMTANIETCPAGKSRVMTVRTEDGAGDFARFRDWIGAEGDRDAALAEWAVRHNATPAAPGV
ncbi:MAG: hypothetical protein H5U20_07095 [Rhodobacteraceae bacterium]|nr:hypothetical protein [Paracoccaceae bacterium]